MPMRANIIVVRKRAARVSRVHTIIRWSRLAEHTTHSSPPMPNARKADGLAKASLSEDTNRSNRARPTSISRIEVRRLAA